MSTPEETHVLILADSISSSVHGANSPLKLGSNIFKHGSAELNLKLWVFHDCQGKFGGRTKVCDLIKYVTLSRKIKTLERKKTKSGRMKIWNWIRIQLMLFSSMVAKPDLTT